MKLLLDTHALLWWLDGDRKLRREQRRAIQRCEALGEPVGIAAITAWEVAQLGAAGRIKRTAADVFSTVEGLSWLEWLPLTPEIALDATRLGASFHRDPADQVIAATARVHGLALVTADERIRDSGAVEVI